MKERSVIVMLRVKVDGKWRRLPAAYGGNGRIRPGYAQVGNQQVMFAGPAYELRFYEDRQAKYRPFKSGAADADAERKKLESSPSKTAAKSAAESAGGTFVDKDDRKTLAKTAAAYIRDAQQRGAMEAAEQARLVTEEFRKLLNRKTYVGEITRDDIFRFHVALRKRGCSDRTIANKHARMFSWLKFAGIDRGLEKNDPARIIPPVPKYEETLRLQTDYIDLYQAHKDDPETPLEETLTAFDALMKQGKVRFICASNYSGARLAEALETSRKHGLASYISLQPHYNLMERSAFETELLPVVEKYQIGAISYYSLAGGFLTGKYRSQKDAEKAARGASVQKYLNERGFRVVAALDEVAHARGSTPARVALAWLLARPGITAPIASATNEKQLADLVAATKLKLDAESIQKLNAASARTVAAEL
jgi:aryl-alcohol dehydrogenase-like predicted oxidoreductase